MKPIESFTLDHINLEPGVYERYTKGDVKTWDIRFKKPNSGDYLNPATSHTLEHFLATYLKNTMKDSIYGVFPMGCLTGFYILTTARTTIKDLTVGLLGMLSYINDVDEIPGATEESCGNYKLQDHVDAIREYSMFCNTVLNSYELDLMHELLDNKSDDTIGEDEDLEYCGECCNFRGERL